MEKNEIHEKQEEDSKPRPLTLFRFIRGVICIGVLVSTPFMILTTVAPITAIVLRFFSIHYSRKATSFLLHHWLALWPLLFESVNSTKVIFSGDDVPYRERVLLISNHLTEVDWMYIWCLALRKRCLGYIKYVLKGTVRNVPIFGWGFHILEFILVQRKWEADKPVLESMLRSFQDPRDPLWLVLFPEGTDFTLAKCKRSQQYAEQHGLPILSRVLLPRTKGFNACLENLRSSLDAVYDVTVSYKHHRPGLMDNIFGLDPDEVHINVRRIPIDRMPNSEDEASSWLFEAFQLKDELLSIFCKEGCFPSTTSTEELPKLKCLLNCGILVFASIIFFISLFRYYWLRLYVILNCCYFICATYCNFRPAPILGRLKSKSLAKKLN